MPTNSWDNHKFKKSVVGINNMHHYNVIFKLLIYIHFYSKIQVKVANQNYLSQRIYETLGHHSKKGILKHFVTENVTRLTICAIFKRYESGKAFIGIKKTYSPQKLTKQEWIKLEHPIGKYEENLEFPKKQFNRNE